MQTRKDQVQAHMFVMGRLTSGVLRLEPDGLDQPVSRTSRGAMGGIAVAVLAALVVALFAFIVPGGKTTWKNGGTLVVVKDSGARYLSIDGVLHPVLNLASARLLAGEGMTVSSMSAKSLREAPRGAPIGLVGAPDSLPAAGDLAGGTWNACATRAVQATGAVETGLSLVIGDAPPGVTLGRESAVAVEGPDGHDYLLWNGLRLRVGRDSDVIQAIGAGATALPPVPAAFLDVVPAGPDLAVPATDGAGREGPDLAGRSSRIGELFTDSRRNHYLLTGQGLVTLTPTLAALYQADPRTQSQAYGGRAVTEGELGPNDISGHLAPTSATAALTHDNELPVTLPAIVHLSADQAICEQLRPAEGGGVTALVVTGIAAVTGRAPDNQAGISPSCFPAQTIAVQSGHGALVTATLAAGGTGSTSYLVTDGGVKYPVPSNDVLSALGYGSSASSSVPAPWMDLLPTGPVLDPGAAATGSVEIRGSTDATCSPAMGLVVARSGSAPRKK